MAGKFLHKVNFEEEKRALEYSIEVYKYFLNAYPISFYEEGYYESIIFSLQHRIALLEKAPKDKNGNILLKCAISSKQK